MLVRKLGVPSLALDSTPYGVDRAAVPLTLPLNASRCLSCCLSAVHDAFICRPREEVLFHFLKTKPGSGFEVWTLHCSSSCGNWSSLVKMPIWCLLQNNFLFFTFTTPMKSKWVSDLMLVYPLAGKGFIKSATFKSFCLVRHLTYAILLRVRKYSWLLFPVQHILSHS